MWAKRSKIIFVGMAKNPVTQIGVRVKVNPSTSESLHAAAMRERNGWIRFRSRLHLLSAQPGLLHSGSPQTLSSSGHLGMHTVDL